jgi:hypothetical protein
VLDVLDVPDDVLPDDESAAPAIVTPEKPAAVAATTMAMALGDSFDMVGCDLPDLDADA